MTKRILSGVAMVATIGALAQAHVKVLEVPPLAPEEGLMLGNGDLSVSVYQDADAIIFRFGKGDVWDRRAYTNNVAKPPTIQEFRDGVLKEGWQAAGGNGGNLAKATKGAKDEKRMLELLGSGNTPIKNAAFPMPKPVGELRMRLPTDIAGQMRTTHRLFIEEGRLEIVCAWPDGISVVADAVVAPKENVLSLAWKVTGWNDHTYLGREKRLPVWFQMWRWADPKFSDWARQVAIACRHSGFLRSAQNYPDLEPLPKPTSFVVGTDGCIEQAFYPDLIFPQGFRYRMTLSMDSRTCGRSSKPAYLEGMDDAWVESLPLRQLRDDGTVGGELAVTVKTSRDASLVAAAPKRHADYVAQAKAAAETYWKSALTIPTDRYLEDLWYSIYHVRRCVLRGGTVPPGLYLPSTINDYSWWHGDYHANYNMEAIYWGDLTANHLEQTEAYFDCCDFFNAIGKKIAKDYYGGRGTFIQLEGYPMTWNDDYAGRLPLGRMAYMTGWFMTRYWEYYKYTCDRDWLKTRGYPFIRDCALFYLDFLQKAPSPNLPPQLNDGRYHAFPSICGEADMKDPMKLCDGWQVMIHCRHALAAAIEAAGILGVDEDLRKDWQDRLDNLPGDYRRGKKTTDYEWFCQLANPPEYRRWASPYAANTNTWDGVLPPRGQSNADTWYEGLQTIWKIGYPRSNSCQPEKTYARFRAALHQWTHANGLVWAMAIQNYGRAGIWSETLSVMAPFQEMMLQSWDGAVNVFPRWPKDQNAGFRNWRTQGAFLVSATFEDGTISTCEIFSEKGETCVMHGIWEVRDAQGTPVKTGTDRFGRFSFATKKDVTYTLKLVRR
ncbi:MAG: hypothetical protein MJ240_00705 [Kiritimatiellae bacterium]|nr:hypothetical protein [Kiritimatiellia bacterium]